MGPIVLSSACVSTVWWLLYSTDTKPEMKHKPTHKPVHSYCQYPALINEDGAICGQKY